MHEGSEMQEWMTDVVAEARDLFNGGSRVALRTLEFHPGLSCPLRCEFCHTSRDPGSIYGGNRYGRSTLSLANISSILREFADRGGERLVVSGGLEPFMSEVALGTAKAARRVGLEVSVYTSGLGKYLTEDSLPGLLGHCNRVRFSVSAATAETYRAVQVPHMSKVAALKTFNKVRNLIARSAGLGEALGTRVGAHFLLRNDNLHEWEAALEFAANAGLGFFDLRADIVPEKVLGRAEIGQVREGVELARKRVPGVKVEFRGPTALSITSAKHCHAWRGGLVIDAFGGVHVCCIVADESADLPPFGFGFVRTGEEFGRLVDKLEVYGACVSQCRVCADRTRLFNSLVDHAGV